jgi:HD superfamily phosphohydrolase
VDTNELEKSRVRSIRDPIHGDIQLDPIESAIVDTRIFQRLRYIRQNGLLHLVFPGAVHTRFAHSLGTMDIARRVAESLFGPMRHSATKAIEYLSQAFRLAALLHDVGHCAFSHSIEHITLGEGKSFLGTTRELFVEWKQHDLLAAYLTHHPGSDVEPVTHEQIGLILVSEIFSQPRVVEACAAATLRAEDLSRDVQALMDGRLPVSDQFKQSASEVARALTDDSSTPGYEDLAKILHGLVSGTLDVDRLDYLVRDSTHCGVPYGLCEVDLLVKSLSIGIVDTKISLLLDHKAVHALDDMLWSRYQLFLQVLNHKTNVGLNAALGEAITQALEASFVQIPKSLADYVAFIDDRIIGRLFEFAQMPNTKLDDKPYIRILVDRRVPRHLEEYRVKHDEDPQEKRAEIVLRLSREHDIPARKIFVGTAKSELKKASQHLPYLVNRRTGEKKSVEEDSSVLGTGGVGSGQYRVLHFYVDHPGA